MTANEYLILLATSVFAVSGVLAAARQNMDVMSFVIIGVVTAIGGGTIRDVMLNAPVFWLHNTSYLFAAAGASVATFFFERWFRATYNALLYIDAVATAMFTILATEKTILLGFPPGVAVVMGIITGIGGGIIRDLMTGQPTILLSRQLYMTPILIGGVLYVGARQTTELPQLHVSLLAMATITFVRLGAIRWGWGFPDWLTYRPSK